MDVLLIHDDAGGRVRLARALRAAAHRVTLCASVEEADEMLRFVRSEAEAPSVVLIAESQLDEQSARLRRRLAERVADLLWLPLRSDLEIGWIARWLSRLELDAVAPRRDAMNVILLEANHGVRRGVAAALAAAGDIVVPCATVAEAREFLARLAKRPGAALQRWVLSAPVICRGSEVISLYLRACRELPNLRWVVRTPQKTTTSRRRVADGTLESVRRQNP